MARRKVWDEPRRTGSHAVVPDGYQLVRMEKPPEEKKARNSDPVSNLFRWLGRHKWQLTPLTAFVGVVWATTSSPAVAASSLFAVGLLLHMFGHRLPATIFGRAWLSEKERSLVGTFAFVACGWSVLIWSGSIRLWPVGLPLWAGLLLIPSVPWLKSRHVRRVRLSKLAKDLQATWPLQMATMGPDKLRGSRIVPGSLADLDGGGLTFLLDLREDVHSKEVANPKTEQSIERRRGQGVGTVQVEVVRDHSGRVRVTLTPERHLERVDAAWPGPMVHDGGEYDYAITYAGETLRLRLYDKDGVKHLVIVGATGGGKSVSLSVAVMAAFSEGASIWYADGGGGDSAPWLAGACDWWAVGGVEEWKAMIQAAMHVAKARGVRRAAQRIGSWRGRKETDPILMLVFDEATAIARQLKDEWQNMVLELAELGRKRGIMVVQVSQHASVDRWIGGGVARDQMRQGGAMVGHAVGSGMASILAVGGTSDPVDLTDLPEEPGFAHIIRQGKSLPVARVLHATETQVLAELQGQVPRSLSKEDQVAAGDGYRLRVRGTDAAKEMETEPVEVEPEGPLRIPQPMFIREAEPMEKALNSAALANQAGADLVRLTIFNFVSELPAGAKVADVAKALDMPHQSVSRHLAYLQKTERLTRDEDGVYTPLTAEVSA